MRTLAHVAAVAIAEIRTQSRSWATWLAMAVPVALGFGLFLYYSFVHGIASGHSATIGGVAPRFLIHSFGSYALLVALLLVGFVSTHGRRHRSIADENEPVHYRAVGNAAIVIGRLAVYALTVWIAMAFLAGLTQIYGLLATQFDLLLGSGVEGCSLGRFLFVDTPLASLFFGSLVVLSAVAIRNRWLAFLAVGSVWLAHGAFLFLSPLGYHVALSFLPMFGQLASDWTCGPTVSSAGWTYAAYSLLTVGCVATAASAYRRTMQVSRRSVLVVGALGIVLGTAALSANAIGLSGREDVRADWLADHVESGEFPDVDILSVEGEVRIEPGVEISYDVTFQGVVYASAEGAELRLSLNPGMRIRTLVLDGEVVPVEHRQGLVVPVQTLPLEPGSAFSMRIAAQGIPDPNFAYLNGELDSRKENLLDSRLHILGSQASVFDASYAGLTDAVAWLPRFAPSTLGKNPGERDFRHVRLDVTLPGTWSLVGTGLTEMSPPDNGDTRKWRLETEVPVAELGLFAAEFTRFEDTIEGIQFEVFLHPEHQHLIDFLHDKYRWLRSELEERLRALERDELEYPYSKFSLVEVPGVYRGYDGERYPRSTRFLPSVFLLREYDLPTARFSHRWRAWTGHYSEEHQEALEEEFAEFWRTYIENDRNGGNLFYGFARSYFADRTCVEGESSRLLEDLLSDWHLYQVHPQTAHFSAFGFIPRELRKAELPLGTIGMPFLNAAMSNAADVQIAVDSGRLSSQVWDIALGLPLSDLRQGTGDPVYAYAYAKKTRDSARTLDAMVRKDRWHSQVAEWRREHGEKCLQASDLLYASEDWGFPTADFILGLVTDRSHASFVLSEAKAYLMEGGGDDPPAYHTFAHVRNDGPGDGIGVFELLELVSLWGIEKQQRSASIRIPAGSSMSVGFESERVPLRVIFTPLSLSANRYSAHAPVLVSNDPYPSGVDLGANPSDWSPETSSAIVVDDLNTGFGMAANDGSLSSSALADLSDDAKLDQGLPPYRPSGYGSMWSRVDFANSWGRHRKTHAYAEAGDGEWVVRFKTELPKAGRWSLEYHLPLLQDIGMMYEVGTYPMYAKRRSYLLPRPQGRYELKLHSALGTRAIALDASQQQAGWQPLGTFDLPGGSVALQVSNRTSGEVVYADAIRWTRIGD